VNQIITEQKVDKSMTRVQQERGESRKNMDRSQASTAERRSKTPLGILPKTILDDGEPKSSKSPCRAASAINPDVVSKEALRKVDVLLAKPVRLNGLYPPSQVCYIISLISTIWMSGR
jgi:hypothetical protein